MQYSELIKLALSARQRSYCPYSHFAVGAALLVSSGKVYTGCNIENASFSPANCAERTAFFKAVSEGETEFSVIAIVGGEQTSGQLDFCPPCGVCRQVMMEFCNPDFKIILAKDEKQYKVFTLEQLLPLGFGPHNLDK